MLLKISKFFLYLSVFSVVIVMTSTFFPFIGGKYYFFRVSVELALIFFILWWAIEAKENEVENRIKSIAHHPLVLGVSAFVLAFLLASIFAYNTDAAFWSNFERGEGGFQMLHYFLFFILLILTFENQLEWKRIFKLSLGAAVLMILYGVFAQLGWSDRFITPYVSGPLPTTFWSKLVSARFQGSLGNPAYVAPYLIFSIFYAFYLWFSHPSKKPILRGTLYGLLIFFFLFFFVLSETKGAFIGLLLAVFGFFVYLSITSPRFRKLALGTILGLAVLVGMLISFRHSNFVQKIPGGRFFQIFDVALSPGDKESESNRSLETRFWTWGSAWQGFKERPILGWGPENFSVVFDAHFDSRHFIPDKQSETWFDRAHSIIFDYLATTGILGLLSYLSIFVIFLFLIFRREQREANVDAPTPENDFIDRPHLLKGLLLAVFIGYFIQGLILFDVLPIYLNLFIVLAFGVYSFQTKKAV